MGIYTSIEFRNANDPEFIKATRGTPEERDEWEDCNGLTENRPGGKVPHQEDAVVETDDEYGGWIVAVKDIPKDATHIVVSRG